MTLEQALQVALQFHQAGQLSQAEDIYRQMLAQQPSHPDALCLLGVVADQTGRGEMAIDLLNRAIISRPHFADAYYHLGNTLKDRGQLDQAVVAYKSAIAARSGFGEASYKLANALVEMGQLDQAIVQYRDAIAARPNMAEAYSNLAAALKDKGQVDQAIALCRTAIALKPDFAEAYTNLSQALLVTGDFPEGWKAFEYRWHCSNFAAHRRVFVQPLWDGSDLTDRTIFLYDEQGFGDTIQFIRYVPMVAARGAKIIVGCPPTLRKLLQHVPGVDYWMEPGEQIPPFDVHCPLMSLPLAMGTVLTSIPQSVPYLHADPADCQRWKQKLAGDPNRFKVGLAWAGNPGHLKDASRSMPLTALAPLAQVPDVSFYNLQMGAAASQLKNPPPGLHLIDLTSELTDFSQTAALIANLDLVIAVDTAVVHLAGSMGKPVWTLLAFAPDWRWLLDRQNSPWYPTMRLFRQPSIGDWDSVARQVTEALALDSRLT